MSVLGSLLYVALGGAVGSAARYLVGAWVASRLGPDFPWGTFIVNASGSFLIGGVLALVEGGTLPVGARYFLAIGTLGGYTTFSTFGYETLQLLQVRSIGTALFNALGQLTICLIAVYLGVVLFRGIGWV